MLRLSSTVAITLAGLLMIHCKPAQSTLTVGQISNYNANSPDHILFLNFRISGGVGGREKVELLSASAGDGKMKDIARSVHFPYQIKAIARYSASAVEREMVFEHPLFKGREVSDPSGHMRQVEVKATEGNVLIRLQQHSGLNQLELFSVSPEKGTVKIYTLDFN
ncbi:hypothetical protein LZD49_06160 [Dyadobacter sp. CY261]|uniref:hypothetical protein n=1 Tax=Dyadobacter sp. CY261 TaxID=2907203 RepID=UPI001F480866|nr:hypothetical protein [Dyadobacter sp. CY261]MCF0070047.1 hypothetical protein [Dyadobacter sp. CY261]